MRKIFLLSVILCAINVYAQDVITLNNGDEIEALVQKIGEVEVTYKKWDFQDGPTFTIRKTEIFRIKYQNGTIDVFDDFMESDETQAEQASYSVPQQPRHPAEPEMIFVEGGTFTTISTLTIALNNFYIGKYVVTKGQWNAVMKPDEHHSQSQNLPITYVSLDDVYEFIKRLNAATGKNYRLPTEAEWEYAARGGNQSRGYKYSGGNELKYVAWYAGNSENLQPVGTRRPNELGIYDMSGNVWEWCQNSSPVLRGGCYESGVSACQLSERHYDVRGGYDHGFRLVLDP